MQNRYQYSGSMSVCECVTAEIHCLCQKVAHCEMLIFLFAARLRQSEN